MDGMDSSAGALWRGLFSTLLQVWMNIIISHKTFPLFSLFASASHTARCATTHHDFQKGSTMEYCGGMQ
jgi:hypothetical protein